MERRGGRGEKWERGAEGEGLLGGNGGGLTVIG